MKQESSTPGKPQPEKAAADPYKYSVILDLVPKETTTEELSKFLTSHTLPFSKVEQIESKDYLKFGIQTSLKNRNGKYQPEKMMDTLYFVVICESKADAVKLSQTILFEKIKLRERYLHLMLHTKKGDYNKSTTLCVNALNYACTEKEIVDELNLILRDDRKKNEEAPKREGMQQVTRGFIMGCIVFVDKDTQRSKQFAFVDFSTPEAAKLCLEAWNEKRMAQYPNRLQVSPYESGRIKMTKEERSRTREKITFSNLYVEKLPYNFGRQDVIDLFSKFGSVVDCKIKKPTSNIPI